MVSLKFQIFWSVDLNQNFQARKEPSERKKQRNHQGLESTCKINVHNAKIKSYGADIHRDIL